VVFGTLFVLSLGAQGWEDEGGEVVVVNKARGVPGDASKGNGPTPNS